MADLPIPTKQQTREKSGVIKSNKRNQGNKNRQTSDYTSEDSGEDRQKESRGKTQSVENMEKLR